MINEYDGDKLILTDNEDKMPPTELFIYKAFSLDWVDNVGAALLSDDQKFELLTLLKNDLSL